MNEADLVFLVADNNEWIVRLMRHYIVQRFGANVQVESARNGAEAVKKFKEIVNTDRHMRLHSILIGCHMPICSGIDAVYEIRRIESENHFLRPVTVIGSSADMCKELKELFVAAGANYALQKPIERDLFDAVYDEISIV